MNPTGSPDSVLWHDVKNEISLVDGPASILEAQSFAPEDRAYALLSSLPQSEPSISQEPKSEAARQRLLDSNTPQSCQHEYPSLLRQALSIAKAGYAGTWALARRHEPTNATPSNDTIHHSIAASDLPRLGSTSPASQSDDHTVTAVDWPFVHNASDCTVRMFAGEGHVEEWLLPPFSTFMLADCSNRKQITAFHTNVRRQAVDFDTPWRFDFILMDPPWLNTSVKRKRNAYKTSDTSHILDMLETMDLDRLMAEDCLVGVWITNKHSIRQAVLDDGGLFDSWGVELIEEWLWLKVTINAEPVCAVDSLWRKPYEVLLLGRRTRAPSPTNTKQATRKVLMSVPDVHSRKPCLKRLIEPYMVKPDRYRALELFARHLVSGWWSWGDECIKYNNTRYWE